MKRAGKKTKPRKPDAPPESPLFGIDLVPKGYVKVKAHLRRLTRKKRSR